MKILIRPALLASTLLLLPFSAMAQSADHDAVHLVMQKFMRAYATSDSALVKEAFREDGVMVGYSEARGDALITRTGKQFWEGFDGKPAADEAQRKRSYEIVDVAENIAAVRVRLDYPGWDGVDYAVLLKSGGTWRIMSKAWTGQVKP